MRATSFRYKAFLSYSHDDRAIAVAIQRGIQRLGKRWYRMRAVRLFRDETNLPLTPGLWPRVAAAIAASEFLVVIATPKAAASEWVRKELAEWRARYPGKVHNVLIVLAGGEVRWDPAARDFDWRVTNALPRAELEGVFEDEPLYGDARDLVAANRPLSLDDPSFGALVARIASPLHGDKDPADLLSEEVAQRRRLLQLAIGTAVVLLVLLVASVLAMREAQRRGELVLGRQLIAEARLLREQPGPYLETSVLLSIEGARRAPSLDADRELRSGLALLTSPEFVRPGDDSAAAVELGRRFTAIAGDRGSITVLDSRTGLQTGRWDEGAAVKHLRIQPGRRLLLVVLATGRARLRELPSGVLRWEGGILAERADGVIDGALAPTRGLVALAGASRSLRILRSDGREVARHTMSASSVPRIVFSPRGTYLGVVEGERLVLYRGGPPFDRLLTLDGATHVVFSEDEQRVAVERLGRIGIFSLPAGGRMGGPSLGGTLVAFAFRPDGKQLAVAGSNNTCVVWDVDRGHEVQRVTHGDFLRSQYFVSGNSLEVFGYEDGADDLVSSVAFSRDGRWLATAGADHTARIWHVASGRELARIPHSGAVRRVAFSCSDRCILSSSVSGEVRSSSIDAAMATSRIVHDFRPVAPVLSREGKVLASYEIVGGDDRVHLWRLDRDVPRSIGEVRLSGLATDVALSADGSRVAIGTQTDGVCVWDLLSGERIAHLPAAAADSCRWNASPSFTRPGSAIERVAWDPTNRDWLAVVRREVDGSVVELVDLRTLETVELGRHAAAPVWLAYSARATYLVVAWQDELGVWDVGARRVVWTRPAHPFVVASDEAERHLAFGEQGRGVSIVSMADGSTIQTVPQDGDAFGLDLAANGEVVAASEGRRVRVWRVGRQPSLELPHDATVFRVRLDGSGRLLATAGHHSYASIWSLDDGAEIARIERGAAVDAVSFAHEEGSLLTVAAGLVQIWPIREDDLVVEACRRVAKKRLDPLEWRRHFSGDPVSTCALPAS